MPKTKISEFSATPGNNTDIDGINIAEGCAPSGINDAIRELMAQLKDFQAGTAGDSFNGPVGTSTAAAGAFTTLSATGVTTVQAGTAGAPAITTTGDTNTGLFFPAADTVAAATGGTERLRLDSSGNLGLGVTPSAWGSTFKAAQIGVGASLAGRTANYTQFYLMANSYYDGSNFKYLSSAAASYYHNDNGAHIWTTAPSGTAGNTISFTQAMTLDASGRLGIGTTSPASVYRMSLTGDGSSIVGGLALTSSGNTAYIGQVGGTSADCEYWNAANGYMRFATNNTERARITSGGDLLVNRTSTLGSAKFVVEADTTTVNPMTVSNSRSTTATDYSILFYRNASLVGSVQTSLTATSYVTSSDYRLKENIAPMTGALSVVSQLKPCTYTWKSTGETSQGFIAHELQAVVPECVTGEKDAVDADGNPKYQGIDTSFLVATLTAAIQELNAKVESLTTELNALKGN